MQVVDRKHGNAPNDGPRVNARNPEIPLLFDSSYIRTFGDAPYN